MSTRSFSVFLDEPSSKPAPPLARSVSASAVLASARGSRAENIFTSGRLGLGPVPEKENVHPITGLGIGPAPVSKKRKASESGSVLSTKVLAVSSGAAKPKRSEVKRRASAAAASGKVKSKRESAKKGAEARKTPVGSDTASSPVQNVPSLSLPRSSSKVLGSILEEATAPVAFIEACKPKLEAKSLTQALIDARCYELTVSPLADVTDAYVQSSESKKADEMKDEDLPEYRTVKEDSSFATQIRDYFSPEGSRSGSLSSFPSSSSISTSLFGAADELVAHSSGFAILSEDDDNDVPSTPKKQLKCSISLPSTPKASVGPAMLSTPERKELYAMFTFMTPKSSPTRSK